MTTPKPLRPVQNLVVEWDVSDGGVLGAVIVCQSCAGSGATGGLTVPGWETCESCSGAGELHRAYATPDGTEIHATPDGAGFQFRDTTIVAPASG